MLLKVYVRKGAPTPKVNCPAGFATEAVLTITDSEFAQLVKKNPDLRNFLTVRSSIAGRQVPVPVKSKIAKPAPQPLPSYQPDPEPELPPPDPPPEKEGETISPTASENASDEGGKSAGFGRKSRKNKKRR